METSFLLSRELNSACGVMPQRAPMKSEGFIPKDHFSFLSLL